MPQDNRLGARQDGHELGAWFEESNSPSFGADLGPSFEEHNQGPRSHRDATQRPRLRSPCREMSLLGIANRCVDKLMSVVDLLVPPMLTYSQSAASRRGG